MVGAGPSAEPLAGQQSHRGAGSRPNAPLAFRRSDAGWTRASRNNPGSLDHGDAVRRLSRRLEPSGTVAGPAGRYTWRLGDNLDDIHSLLSMDLFGRPLH